MITIFFNMEILPPFPQLSEWDDFIRNNRKNVAIYFITKPKHKNHPQKYLRNKLSEETISLINFIPLSKKRREQFFYFTTSNQRQLDILKTLGIDQKYFILVTDLRAFSADYTKIPGMILIQRSEELIGTLKSKFDAGEELRSSVSNPDVKQAMVTPNSGKMSPDSLSTEFDRISIRGMEGMPLQSQIDCLHKQSTIFAKKEAYYNALCIIDQINELIHKYPNQIENSLLKQLEFSYIQADLMKKAVFNDILNLTDSSNLATNELIDDCKNRMKEIIMRFQALIEEAKNFPFKDSDDRNHHLVNCQLTLAEIYLTLSRRSFAAYYGEPNALNIAIHCFEQAINYLNQINIKPVGISKDDPPVFDLLFKQYMDNITKFFISDSLNEFYDAYNKARNLVVNPRIRPSSNDYFIKIYDLISGLIIAKASQRDPNVPSQDRIHSYNRILEIFEKYDSLIPLNVSYAKNARENYDNARMGTLRLRANYYYKNRFYDLAKLDYAILESYLRAKPDKNMSDEKLADDYKKRLKECEAKMKEDPEETRSKRRMEEDSPRPIAKAKLENSGSFGMFADSRKDEPQQQNPTDPSVSRVIGPRNKDNGFH